MISSIRFINQSIVDATITVLWLWRELLMLTIIHVFHAFLVFFYLLLDLVSQPPLQIGMALRLQNESGSDGSLFQAWCLKASPAQSFLVLLVSGDLGEAQLQEGERFEPGLVASLRVPLLIHTGLSYTGEINLCYIQPLQIKGCLS